jgi:hypothetical protein
MKRLAASAVLVATWLLAAPGSLVAQVPDNLKAAPRPAQPAPIFQESANADEVRQRLHELFRQYPPALYEVLRIDPTLITRSDYLAPYPALAAFLQQHPEIARTPTYYIGEFRYNPPRVGDRSYELAQMILAGMGFTLLGSAFIGVFIWLVKTAIDHRRWLRLTRTQTEVHTKLLDRIGTNEELLAYIQSPAGRRFLESTPISLEPEPRMTTSAPVSRILWTMQAGVVLGALGMGFWLVQTRTTLEVSEGFWVIGVLIAALGFGFLASAVVAYVISSRLGLMHRPKTEQEA